MCARCEIIRRVLDSCRIFADKTCNIPNSHGGYEKDETVRIVEIIKQTLMQYVYSNHNNQFDMRNFNDDCARPGNSYPRH